MRRAAIRQSTRPHGVVWAARNRGRIGWIGLLALAVLAAVPDWIWAQERELGYAIDISHHTGKITKGDVGCWLNNGVEHIIVRASISEELNDLRGTSRQQLETLWKAMYEDGLNFSVDIYLYVHWPPNVGKIGRAHV